MTFVLGAIFTIVLVVKEVVILGNFNQVCERPFPSPFFSGVARGLQGAVRCARGHRTHEQHKNDLLVSTLDINRWWSVVLLRCIINF